MTCFISLGKINKKFIRYPLSAIIILIIKNILAYKTNLFQYIGKHIFIMIISKGFGKSLSLILYLFLNKKNKNSKKEEAFLENELVYKKEYVKDVKSIKYKRYIVIFISCTFAFTYKIFYQNFGGVNIGKFSLWVINIIYVCIFSYFILNTKLYQHQYFSIIILVILGVALNIINLYGANITFINTIIVIAIEGQCALNVVLNKHLMDNLFCTAYEVCFYEGFFAFLSSIICLTIFTNKEMKIGRIKYKDKNYVDNFYVYLENLNIKEIFVFFFHSFIHLIGFLLCLLTIKYYTIFHIYILLIVDQGNYFAHDLKDWKLYIILILYFFVFLMILVFNENIELNFWGLQKNLKKNIVERATLETSGNTNFLIDDNNSEMQNVDESIEIGQYKFNLENNESSEDI